MENAYFAGGCFWGVEYYFSRVPGVLSVESGFMGGSVANPSYEQVCGGQTGHYEAVHVTFDPAQTGFEALARLFFEIHDPTQEGRQGPDIGTQYRSAIFAVDGGQRACSEALIAELTRKGYAVKTRILDAAPFYRAEDYHQSYYAKTGKLPYCHSHIKRF